MNEKHEKLKQYYWDAVECGSSDEQWRAHADLEKFEYEGIKNGTIDENDVLLKYVILFE